MNIKWNYDSCKKEAEKYSTKFDFRKKSPSAYSAAWRNKWLVDFIWLGTRQYEIDKNKKDYCVYSYEIIETNKVYVGLTNNIKRRDRQHRFGIKHSMGVKYSNLHAIVEKEKVKFPSPKILYSGLTSCDAQIKEKCCIDEYALNGWEIINIGKTGYGIGSLGSTWLKWDKEACFKEALKYSQKSEFKKNSSGAYASSIKHGWYESYTWFGDNKNNNKHKKGHWDYEACYKEAMKYNSKKEFEKKSETAAKKAWKNKWMKDYVWFTPSRKKNYWNYETCKNASKECKTRTEFYKKYNTAYKLSIKNNWIEEFYGKK